MRGHGNRPIPPNYMKTEVSTEPSFWNFRFGRHRRLRPTAAIRLGGRRCRRFSTGPKERSFVSTKCRTGVQMMTQWFQQSPMQCEWRYLPKAGLLCDRTVIRLPQSDRDRWGDPARDVSRERRPSARSFGLGSEKTGERSVCRWNCHPAIDSASSCLPQIDSVCCLGSSQLNGLPLTDGSGR